MSTNRTPVAPELPPPSGTRAARHVCHPFYACVVSTFALLLAGLALGCTPGLGSELASTGRALGVPVRPFPPPQGQAEFDELPTDAPAFAFDLEPWAGVAPEVRAWYATRNTVSATGPDGTRYEAYCGEDDPKVIRPGHGFDATLGRTRQTYGRLYFSAEYAPDHVFVGTREGGLLDA